MTDIGNIGHEHETVSIFSVEDEGDRAFWSRNEVRYGRDDIDVHLLTERVDTFLASVGRILSSPRSEFEGFSLREVVVSAEISTTGKVSILGCGGEVGGKGGIEFRFVRK
jgi:hypothetical protein